MGEWLEPAVFRHNSRQYLGVHKEAPYAMGEEGLPWCGREERGRRWQEDW